MLDLSTRNPHWTILSPSDHDGRTVSPSLSYHQAVVLTPGPSKEDYWILLNGGSTKTRPIVNQNETFMWNNGSWYTLLAAEFWPPVYK